MAKVTVYNMTEEDFANVSTEEFISKYANSRSKRAYGRISNNPEYKTLMAKIKKVKEKDPNKVIKTHVREAVILPEWIGLKFGVHNGKEFVPLHVTSQCVGNRLGDYSHTTKRVMHSGPGVGATRGSKFVPMK
jgi:small subunit ribosomal protein S19